MALTPRSRPSHRLPEASRDLVSALLGREVVRQVVEELCSAAIPIMPLKGVLLQQLVYSNPARRKISDVDLLVPEADFCRAVRVLLKCGYKPLSVGRSLIEVALRSPLGLTVDLHRQPFSPGRYRLTGADLFRRSTANVELFDAPVRLAHPLDTLAHLLGKWVSDHELNNEGLRLRDVTLVVEHYCFQPAACACHLEGVGLARALRYLARRANRLGCSFLQECSLHLSPDPIGERIISWAEFLVVRHGPGAGAAVAAHLLNCSLSQGLSSAVAVASRRLAHACFLSGYWPVPEELKPFLFKGRGSVR